MKGWYWSDIAVVVGVFLAVVLILTFLAYGIVLGVTEARVTRACLDAGYPDHRIAGLDGYCVRWDDAGQIVVPVELILDNGGE